MKEKEALKMKRIFAIIILISLLVSFFCGCSAKRQDMQVTITDKQETVYQQIIWMKIGNTQYPQIINHFSYSYKAENHDHVEYEFDSETEYNIGDEVTIKI